MGKWLDSLRHSMLLASNGNAKRSQQVRVEQRIWLGQNQSLILVSVFGRTLLIGATQNSIQVLERNLPTDPEARC